MNTKLIEVTVGIFVAAGLAALFMLAMKVSNLSTLNTKEGYRVAARFENVGGLKSQAPVNAGGVRIGRVTSITYDQETYEAEVHMMIDRKYDRIPVDTTASIYTAGLLGEQYVSLEPGGAVTFLKDGDRIKLTQSALVMEKLVGQFLFDKASSGTQTE
jgi:phospholipid/cholesterol/gamma-HCH transport system substrate-binding protein